MRTLKCVIESQFSGEIGFGIEKWLNITGIRMSQGIKGLFGTPWKKHV